MLRLLLHASDDVVESRTILNSQLANLTDPDPDPDPDTSDDEGGPGGGPPPDGGNGRKLM